MQKEKRHEKVNNILEIGMLQQWYFDEISPAKAKII